MVPCLRRGDNCVQAIAFDAAGHTYAGGWFMHAGGVPVNKIARWDGTAWSSLNGGIDGFVLALGVGPGGVLYAGGGFATAGGVAASNIARWDGAQWTPLGAGVDGWVHAIVVDDAGIVVACGRFTTAGGVAARHIARWDGATWHPLGGGINGLPAALALDSVGNLAAGGIFSQAARRGTAAAPGSAANGARAVPRLVAQDHHNGRPPLVELVHPGRRKVEVALPGLDHASCRCIVLRRS
jgi:hypothetical protein